MQDFEFYRPGNLLELKEYLSLPGARVLAGGTDIIPKMRQGKFTAPILVDTSGVKSLDFIEDQGERIVLGAMTTHQQLAESRLIQETNPALRAAAASIGCIQTRCRGTLGGNIANGSPAGDTLPPLLIYDAEVLLQSLEGERSLSLEKMILGPGQTALEPGELIHSISYQPLKGKWGSCFLKVGKRSGMAISVVNAAGAVVLDSSGQIADVRLALGAVGPVVIRCLETEKSLLGKRPDQGIFQQASEMVQHEINPIQDVRSTTSYRAHAGGVIAARVLGIAAERAARRKD